MNEISLHVEQNSSENAVQIPSKGNSSQLLPNILDIQNSNHFYVNPMVRCDVCGAEFPLIGLLNLHKNEKHKALNISFDIKSLATG